MAGVAIVDGHSRRYRRAVWLIAGCLTFYGVHAQPPTGIGVLAFTGTQHTLARWSATADYLSRSIDGVTFEIVPVNLSEMADAVRSRRVDFVLTNPGNYVLLEAQHGVSRIATLKNRREGRVLTQFGAVVFTRADRHDIAHLEDLKGLRFAAVSEHAFGGYQMAWRELREHGIEPADDFAARAFLGFPQDAIVLAVAAGTVDAGTVRTDVLDRMAREGTIARSQFKVLSPLQSAGFPFEHSTRLYPEWPFAKLRHASDELAQRVAVALLTLSADESAALTGGYAGWTIPLDYSPVHDLMRDLEIAPYERSDVATLGAFVARYWLLLLGGVLGLALLSSAAAWLLRTRQMNVALRADIDARLAVERTLRRSDAALRRLHEITIAPGETFESKVAQLLAAGCEHFDMRTGVVRFNPAHHAHNEISSDADPDNLDEVYAVASIAPALSTEICAGTEEVGELMFFGMARDQQRLSAVDEDILTLMAQWIGSAVQLERMEIEARQRLDELALVARRSALGEMASGLAHELNQPLTAILNFTRGCMRKVTRSPRETSAEIRAALGEIEHEAERAAGVLRGVRAFVRNDVAHRDIVDVNHAVQEVLRIVGPDLRRHHVRLALDLGESIPGVEADAVQLEQVILNLVRNGLESLREAEWGAREIAISTWCDHDDVGVSVADSGAGLSAQQAEQVFAPFYSTKPEGMGMGLSISRTIVEAHGGRLQAAPDLSHGARFCFYLPAYKRT